MRSTSRTHQRASALRRSLSPPEVLIWVRLRERLEGRPAFRRQHAIGPYIADFFCAKARLVVEIDGSSHGDARQITHDETRDAYLAKLGLAVMRVSSGDALSTPDDVADGIVRLALDRIRQIGR